MDIHFVRHQAPPGVRVPTKGALRGSCYSIYFYQNDVSTIDRH
jgi:hypothetical protein